MVIIMNPDATAENIKGVIEMIQDAGLSAKVMEGSQQRIVGVIGDKTRLASCAIDALPGVERSVSISKSYKLASREFHPQSSVIDVDGVPVGGDEFVVMAGPCAVETVAEYADLLQIGARNMQNFRLLKEVGRTQKPVMLKRGLAATLDEWLNAAEYILNEGNPNVIFCERGIRTYETYTRNTLDLSAVAAIKHLSHLPIIVDPSHGTGKWRFIKPMALAAVACGADGLIMEMHPNPAKALSDGPQSLTPENYNDLMDSVTKLAKFMKESGIKTQDL